MKKRLREKILGKIADIIDRYPVFVFLGVMVVTFLALIFASRIKFDTEYEVFMPENARSIKAMKEIRKKFGSVEDVIIVIEGENLIKAKKVADELALRFEKHPKYFLTVFYKIPTDFFQKYGLLFLSRKEIKDLTENIKKEKKELKKYLSQLRLGGFFKFLNERFEREYGGGKEMEKGKEGDLIQAMETLKKLVSSVKKSLERGVLPDSSELKDALGGFFMTPGKKEERKTQIKDGYFVSKDGKMLILFVRLSKSLTEEGEKYLFSLNKKLRGIVGSVKKRYPEVSIRMTGAVVGEMEEREAQKQGFSTSLSISFILILVLLMFSFRMWSTPLIAVIPLVIGLIWAMGFAGLTLGKLNIFSSIFAVVIMGLSVDFGIHMISRYTEERGKNHSVSWANKMVLTRTTQGIFTGALTTAAAFLTFVFLEFKGYADFGLLGGAGLLIALLAFILVVPLLFIFKDRKIVTQERRIKSQEFPFLGKIGNLIVKRKWWVLGIGTGITLVFLFLVILHGVPFESDLKKMEPRTEAFLLRDTIIERFGVSPDALLITARSKQEMERLTRKLKKLEDQGKLGEVQSLATFIPKNQHERLQLIQKLRDVLEGIDMRLIKERDFLPEKEVKEWLKEMKRFRLNMLELSDLSYISGMDSVAVLAEIVAKETEDLLKRAEKNRKLPGILGEYEKILARMMEERWNTFKKMTLVKDTITPDKIPASILREFVSKDGKSYLIRVSSAKDLYDLKVAFDFTSMVQRIAPNVTGLMVFTVEVLNIAWKSIKWAILYALIAIILVLFADFRKPELVFAALTPVIFGLIWLLGILYVFRMKLNLSSVMILPLILGIGIDDGVHIIHRYLEEGQDRIPLVLRHTGKAVLLTTLTTVMAFGSLTFSKMPAMASLGWMISIGLFACLFISVIILPALLKVLDKKRR